MRKFVLVLMLLAFASVSIMAQSSSMTDSQIIEFIQKEQQAGTSQQQISVKLLQSGVSVQRLQMIRKKYENLGGQSAMGAKDLSTSDRSRSAETLRNAQASKETTNVSNATTMRMPGQSSYSQKARGMSADGANEEATQMESELNGFMPDSIGMLRMKLAEYESMPKRRVFGRDIFNNEFLSFEPNMNIATPDDYILGPGDQVYIDIYGASQKSIEATVTPDGDVNIEDFGPIQVSGLTVSRANQRLRSQLGARYASSNIRLTVGQTRTIMVNVMGEVAVPGTYTLSAFSSVFHALYMAGGVSEIGTLRDIKVYRKNKLISSVDIYDYILNGKLTGNVRLADNDVIVVGPYECLVEVQGKVKRPMFYEMRKDESLGTLMKYSGGFTGDAYTNSVRVLRKAGSKYSVWNVTEFDMNTFTLSDEDLVEVDSVNPRYENMVELKGAVQRPGMYQIGGNITTVRELMAAADGLMEEAFADHVIMHRMKADRSLEVLSFNLNAIIDGTEPDVTLQNEDVVFIPSKEDRNSNMTIQIFGEVYYPGQYQYAENMTVEDFILQAGGLKETASTQRVIVSRRVASTVDQAGSGGYSTKKKGKGSAQERGASSQTFEIDLQDGFAINGDEGFRLQPFDEVYVGKIPGFNEQVKVEIDGEANFRGMYAMAQKNARLSDLVAQAGGVTNDAWIRGARVIRKMDEEERARREKQVIDLRVYNAEIVTNAAANVAPMRRDLVDSLLYERYVNIDEYVVGIELDKALKEPGGTYDITLRDGDRLYIPQYDGTVKISGEVNFPCSATYEKGKSARHYINSAGGYSGAGWRGHAYVVHANGTVDRVGRGASVEPGCEIIVPVRPIKTTSNLSTWISALSSLGTIAALIITALN